jgi:nanoRNase/pAp phosphatase (c-di-AMP/oligoRNAs hydrolase)
MPVEQDKISLSARCQSQKIDTIEILKKATQGLEDIRVGGHKNASGASIKKQDLQTFKKNLSQITV